MPARFNAATANDLSFPSGTTKSTRACAQLRPLFFSDAAMSDDSLRNSVGEAWLILAKGGLVVARTARF
jgi:hypothetical protein